MILGIHYKFLAFLVVILALNGSTTLAADQNSPKRVEIGVYFEALCPDSIRFFRTQLGPIYKQLSSVFQPVFVPFGHARVLGNNKMVCQHGAGECERNRFMACALIRAPTEKDAVDSITCLMTNEKRQKDCISSYLPTVSYDDINTCKDSDESYQMMAKFETLTGKPRYIPKITMNGQWSDEIQNLCERDLKTCVCNNYNGTKPESCLTKVEN